jgi:aconitate hydratase
MRLTGRTAEQVELVERYTKEQGLFHTESASTPEFTKRLSLDMSTVVPSLAGPKRPQDRVPMVSVKEAFQDALKAPAAIVDLLCLKLNDLSCNRCKQWAFS